jgi:Ca2+/Na+ antiporter
MTVQNKKRSMIALMVILTFLIAAGSLGGRFGSYTWVALIWLGTVVLSIGKLTFAKDKDYLSKSNFMIGGLFSSIAFILAFPFVDAHPVKVLLAYLPLHFYIIYYVVTKKGGQSQPEIALGIISEPIQFESTGISDETRQKCREYIGEDEIERAIDLLIDKLTSDNPNYNDALQIKQKWNRIEREKNLNTISPDDADRQFSRVVQTLLDILND